jgi:hypothetical protein
MVKVKKTQQQIIAENEKISDQILKDLRSKGGDNMNGEAMADEKLMAGISFRDLKKMPGKTITEKLQKAGIKNIPKTLTLDKAIQLLNKKRAN